MQEAIEVVISFQTTTGRGIDSIKISIPPQPELPDSELLTMVAEALTCFAQNL